MSTSPYATHLSRGWVWVDALGMYSACCLILYVCIQHICFSLYYFACMGIHIGFSAHTCKRHWGYGKLNSISLKKSGGMGTQLEEIEKNTGRFLACGFGTQDVLLTISASMGRWWLHIVAKMVVWEAMQMTSSKNKTTSRIHTQGICPYPPSAEVLGIV